MDLTIDIIKYLKKGMKNMNLDIRKIQRFNKIISVLLIIVLVLSIMPEYVRAGVINKNVIIVVTDDLGNLLENVNLTIQDKSDESNKIEKITDSEGKVTLELDEEKEWVCNAKSDGYNLAQKTIDFGETECNIVLTKIETKVDVSGTVKDNENEIIADASVKIVLKSDIEEGKTYDTQTDADGKFEISGVVENRSYDIIISKEGYRIYQENFDFEKNEYVLNKLIDDEETQFEVQKDVEIQYGKSFQNKVVLKEGRTSDISINYYTSDSEIAKVDNNGIVELKNVGDVTISATIAADNIYMEKTISYELKISEGLQEEFKFETTGPVTINYLEGYQNIARGGSGDGSIVYSSSDENVVKVDDNGVIETVSAGTAIITAEKLGEGKYENINQSYEITVKKINQEKLILDLTDLEKVYSEDMEIDLDYLKEERPILGGSTDNPVTYSIECEEGVAELVEDSKIKVSKPGTIKVIVTKEGNGGYNDVTASYNIIVKKMPQDTFGFNNTNEKITIKYGDEFENVASGGADEDIPVTYISSDESIASVGDDGKVTVNKAGEVTITAAKKGNEYYEDITKSYILKIEKAEREITFQESNPQNIVYGVEFVNKASVSAAKGEYVIQYSLSDESIADVNEDGTLSIHKAGTVTITAKVEADDCYKAAESSYTLTIEKVEQSVSFEKAKDTFEYNPENTTYSIVDRNKLVNKESAGKVIYTMRTTEDGAEYKDFDEENGSFVILAAGKFTIHAQIEEDDCYKAADVEYTLIVKKADQTIKFQESEYTLLYGKNFAEGEIPKAEITSQYGSDNSNIEYSIVKGNDIASIDSETGKLIFNDEKTGVIIVKALMPEDGCFNSAEATYQLNVEVLEVEDENTIYQIAGDYIDKEESDEESRWYIGNVDIVAKEGYKLSVSPSIKEDNEWKDRLENVVPDDTKEQDIIFYAKAENSGITGKITVCLKRDSVVPTGKLEIEKKDVWDKILTFVKTGNTGKDLEVKVKDIQDDTSGIFKVEYYCPKYNGEDTLTKEELDKVVSEEWEKAEFSDKKNSTASFELKKNQRYRVYVRLTDNAGNYSYINTNGIISDEENVGKIVLTPDVANDKGYYNSDVTVNVFVDEEKDESYSGISKIEYYVTIPYVKSEGTENESKEDEKIYKVSEKEERYVTQHGVLFEFANDNPSYDELKKTFDSEVDSDEKLVVDSKLNNNDDVKVYVVVTDNAGNTTDNNENPVELKIDITKPQIKVEFDNNDCKNTVEGRGYFDAERTATVTITERPEGFDKNRATESITITAVDSEKNNVAIPTFEWIEKRDGENPDNTTFTAKIKFENDAKYDFAVSYTDNAGNDNADIEYGDGTQSSEKFAVDIQAPTDVELKMIEKKEIVWDKLLETLTFGIYRSKADDKEYEYKFEINAKDATSPYTIDYYIVKADSKTTDMNMLTNDELDELEEWTAYDKDKKINVSEEAKFVIYVRVKDYAGNRTYISSNGLILDKTPAGLTVSAENKANDNGYYNSDVTVNVFVNEEKDESYSGISKIEYYVTIPYEKTESTEKRTDENTDESTKLRTYRVSENEERYVTQYGVLFEYADDNPSYEELKKTFNSDEKLVVDSKLNNDDDVKVYVVVTDNAGNTTDNNENPLELKIDITKPQIKVEFDNNDCKNTVEGRGYFDAERTATVSITERPSGFETDKVEYLLSDDDKVVLSKDSVNAKIEISAKDAKGDLVQNAIHDYSWTKEKTDSENASDDKAVYTYTAKIVFEKDANYDFIISCTDNAGNSNDDVKYVEETITPNTFTVDTKAPQISVEFDNNDCNKVLKDRGYYKKARIATVKIQDETSAFNTDNIVLAITSKDVKGNAVNEEKFKLENLSWEQESPEDKSVYVARIEFNEDANYTFKISYTDNVGNPNASIAYGDSKTPNTFTVDTKAPQINVEFDNNDCNKVLNDRGYYKKARIAIVKIQDETSAFNTDNIVLAITSKDVKGNAVNEEKFKLENLSWEQENPEDKSVYIARIEFNEDANYTFKISYTDNAGNPNASIAYGDSKTPNTFTVDTKAPQISVEFDNNDCKKTVNGRGYYSQKRIATIKIQDETSAFNEENVTLSVTGTDVNGKAIEKAKIDLQEGAWRKESASDSSVYTAKLEFKEEANYTFNISYADNAGNSNAGISYANGTKTPIEFTIDTSNPTGSVSINKESWADKLLTTLTFKIWSNEELTVSGSAEDNISPIDKVYYYKTSEPTAKTLNELDNINNWNELNNITSFKKFSILSINKDEQFTVYLKIQDYAGRISYIGSNGAILDKTESGVSIDIIPESSVRDFYNNDVNVRISVKEEEVNGAFSGLKQISYRVLNMGDETQHGELYQFDIENPTKDNLRKDWSGDIVVSSSLNNSNNVEIEVTAVDNAGNRHIERKEIAIDITLPEISVVYDNNNGDTSFGNETLFKENRTATITITERNFNADDVKVTITNTENVIPVISGWSDYSGSGNGDDVRHTATITYSADGDYTFDITYTDMAGNAVAEPVNYGNSLAPTLFTIDKTAPVVSLRYDNNSVMNGNFYKADRNATITIAEHNFETSRVSVTIKATDDGKEISVPNVSSWSGNGDVHIATINFANDGLYTMDIAYVDKAGNQANTVATQTFYIDKTLPSLEINGITDNSANSTSEDIGFVLECKDTNMDVFEPVLTTVVKEDDKFVTKTIQGSVENIKNGSIFTITNLPLDGLYSLSCKAVDKAGNEYDIVSMTDSAGKSYTENRTDGEALITFSVNREGSVFEPSKAIIDLVDKYYVQSVDEDLVITETNVDPLKTYVVKLNGNELKQETDYTVNVDGGNGQWSKYTYTINKGLFTAEEEYNIIVESVDKADTIAYSDVKNLNISFVVDKTAPVVTISGVKNEGRYQVQEQTVTAIPTDDGGKLKSFKAVVLDSNGNTLKDASGKDISSRFDLSGEELETYLKENAGIITFAIPEGLENQVVITCNDCSVDSNGNTNEYSVAFRKVTVSTSRWIIFYANKPLFYGSIVGTVALICGIVLLIIFVRRKKNNTKKTS